ncbi:MAG: mono/diheme cytochrome c family protein [Pirellulaceae bacterium]|jgi:mono/diheme cytochrome c family protein
MPVSSPRKTALARLAAVTFFMAFSAAFFAAFFAAERNGFADEGEGLQLYQQRVEPLLRKNCFSCHSHDAKKSKGGLVVDLRSALLKGGESGPAIVPGKPDKSLLISAVMYDELKMPPKGKLGNDDIELLKKWIELGAPVAASKLSSTVPRDVTGGVADQLWSLLPIRRPLPPEVSNRDWPLGEIDRFVLKRLEQAELDPVASADKRTLLRRIYFDLIGLPPTPEEMDAFLSDNSPNAYDNVVDDLLNSQHFGERWGRHWMDVIRYADSVGGGANMVFDNAWKYRDWIIKSLNQDMPYDQFLMKQIAGDLLPAEDDKQKTDQIIATGFFAIGRKELPEYDKDKLRMDVIDEQLDTLGKSMLGLSLGCARCHDHKFDPITTMEYYALAGILESTEVVSPPTGGPISTWVTVNLPDKSGSAIAVREAKNVVDAQIRIRGEENNRGEKVVRGFLNALPHTSPPPSKTSSGRLELGQWVAAADNPLTSRVMVNRIWLWLMGKGLVTTPDNFGVRGQLPTHPLLLDSLASKFIDDDWSVKKMVRRIVLSRTYQLSSRVDDDSVKRDPENSLYWRHPRKRLQAEIIRDAMLAASGQIDRTQFGKTLTFGGRLDEGKEKKLNSDPWRRRSVYLPQYREDKQVDIMMAFDGPHPSMVTGQRARTTVPTQALYLLNSPFVMEQATAMADRLLSAKDIDDGERITLAYRIAVGRPPTEKELEQDRDFLKQIESAAAVAASTTDAADNRRQAWMSLCHTILISNEFLFVE